MKNEKVKVLFAASECMPYAKVGGLADVVGSLPKALKEMGIDVRICLPKYQTIDLKETNTEAKFELVAKGIKIGDEKINIYQGLLQKSEVILYLLDNERYFGENGIYFGKTEFFGSFKGIQRFLFFSKAILEIFPYLDWWPQIIHCHDWHTAIISLLLKIRKQNIRTLLTIHNLSNQGKWAAQDIFNFLNLKGNEIETLKIRDKGGDFNILQQGILNADMINTVSPTYAKEILTKEYGEGLEADLNRRKKDLFGILNGIDTQIFNPATDPNLKVNYSQKDFEKRKINKADLQKILNLPPKPEIPLASFISRLVKQKGLDLIEKIIPELVKLHLQIVFLGVGEKKYEKMLSFFAKKYPESISANLKFDSVLAQKIYAGSDIFLIPSLFEPCGLIQMLAQRYGAIPIARKTGGLADTIEDKKTGFLFKKYSPEAFLKKIKEALVVFSKRKDRGRMVKKAMRKDFSWKKSAKKYIKLYYRLLSP
ncbi:MAG: glycogen/starch synthase [Patescibacteria group bacterium]|nr:glycogen/starch synthase [Patescibacteria group bacterium]